MNDSLAAPLRIVLDTNVWLDIVVFEDARCASLVAAWARGRIHVVSSSACLAELHHTARRAPLRARAPGLDAALATLVARVAIVDTAAPAHLPTCRDRSDQKFVEVAVAARCDALITKDRALLKLAKRLRPMRVVPPSAALDAWLAEGLASPVPA